MEDSFVYEAKGPTLIIHLPKEFDHHNCRNLRYETDLLMAENYVSGSSLILRGRGLWTAPALGSS